MKRFIPVIALLFVVALSSYTTISSANKAKNEKGKATVTHFFKYDYTTSQWINANPGDESDVDICPAGSQKVCVIELVKGDETKAKAYALGLSSPAFASGPVTNTTFDPDISDEQVIVYPRN